MKYDPEKHHRRSIRLKEYDYSQIGAYFITACTQNRECLFGEIVNGEMRLNDAGRMVQIVWNELPQRFSRIRLDALVTMPNHIHGVITIENDCRGESCIRPKNEARPQSTDEPEEGDHKPCPEYVEGDRPYGTKGNSVGRIIQAFKSITVHEYTIGVKQRGWLPFPGRLWQRNYYEHLIRNEDDLQDIREYIANNPVRWAEDENNPVNLKSGRIQDSLLQR